MVKVKKCLECGATAEFRHWDDLGGEWDFFCANCSCMGCVDLPFD